MRSLLPLVACLAAIACGSPEDPARVELRERLRDEAPLSSDELGRFRGEIGKTIAGRTFLKEGTQPLNEEERVTVLGMLTEPAGMYDEGLREKDGAMFRVLNSPGRSSTSEIEATRRLWIDIETFLPGRFEFSHAFPGYGEYAFDMEAN